MSIELTGPKKYKFQDHVCVLLAILAVTDADASLQIEPQDGEDALLALTKGGNTHFVEIQVKGAQGLIGPENLADWLAHFPARQAGGSLLERLVTDAQRSVFFVASGRCNDATVVHTIQLSAHTTSLAPGTVKQETEAGMRTALAGYANASSSTDKDLAKNRRAHIEKQLSLIPCAYSTPNLPLKTIANPPLVMTQSRQCEGLSDYQKYSECRPGGAERCFGGISDCNRPVTVTHTTLMRPLIGQCRPWASGQHRAAM